MPSRQGRGAVRGRPPRELVVEVQYDHVSGDRFRHGTTLLRWRPAKDPRQCRLAQIAAGADAALLFG